MGGGGGHVALLLLLQLLLLLLLLVLSLSIPICAHWPQLMLTSIHLLPHLSPLLYPHLVVLVDPCQPPFVLTGPSSWLSHLFGALFVPTPLSPLDCAGCPSLAPIRACPCLCLSSSVLFFIPLLIPVCSHSFIPTWSC